MPLEKTKSFTSKLVTSLKLTPYFEAIAFAMPSSDRRVMRDLFCNEFKGVGYEFIGFTQKWIEWFTEALSHRSQLRHHVHANIDDSQFRVLHSFREQL